jgi:polyketide cyclase/dehydrase/lipid transport protein
MRAFHLVTSWSFRAPIERVFAEIAPVDRYASWWEGFERSEPGEEDGDEVVRQRVKGFLGARLSFVQRHIDRQPPLRMHFLSTGDLVGEGRWELRSDGERTEVTLTWDVDLGRRWMRALAKVPGMRTVMIRSHHALMEKGRAALARRTSR